MKKIRFKNWEEYQHYKDRAPPWIKLHFSILSSRHWIKLDESGKLLAIVCMMIASRNAGEVECDEEYVMAVGNLKKRPDFDSLVECGFCEYCDGLLDKCNHDASNLQQTYVSVSASASDSSLSLQQAEAENIYSHYPRKEARQVAIKAILSAQKKCGSVFLLDRVKAYSAAVALWPDGDKKFVPHPATWFNQGRYDDDPATWVREGSAKPKTLRQEDLI